MANGLLHGFQTLFEHSVSVEEVRVDGLEGSNPGFELFDVILKIFLL